jgi:hypothetical protein
MPCFEFFKYYTGRLRFFFWSGRDLIAPPVVPPSDLDRTRPTDSHTTVTLCCRPPYCE